MKRQRGRGRKPGNSANRTFESNGPEVKIRGNATQIHDKYLQLARDASSSGDRVRAENLYQHAEHYYRIIQANQPKRDPAAEEGGENAEVNGENAEGEERTARDQGDGNERRGRGRGRGRGRRPQDDDTSREDEQSETAAAEGEDSSEEAATPSGDDEAPRRRTRRPRRPRASEDGESAEASADAGEKSSEDSESEAA